MVYFSSIEPIEGREMKRKTLLLKKLAPDLLKNGTKEMTGRSRADQDPGGH